MGFFEDLTCYLRVFRIFWHGKLRRGVYPNIKFYLPLVDNQLEAVSQHRYHINNMPKYNHKPQGQKSVSYQPYAEGVGSPSYSYNHNFVMPHVLAGSNFYPLVFFVDFVHVIIDAVSEQDDVSRWRCALHRFLQAVFSVLIRSSSFHKSIRNTISVIKN